MKSEWADERGKCVQLARRRGTCPAPIWASAAAPAMLAAAVSSLLAASCGHKVPRSEAPPTADSADVAEERDEVPAPEMHPHPDEAAQGTAAQEDPDEPDAAGFAPLPNLIRTVTYVWPGTLPDRMGIRRGDVISAVNGEPLRTTGNSRSLTSATDIATKARPHGPTPVAVQIVRSGKEMSLTVPHDVEGGDWQIEYLPLPNPLRGIQLPVDPQPRGMGYLVHSVHLAASLDWRGALEAGEKALQAGLRNPDVLAHLGRCCQHLADYGKGESYCRQALELDPAHGHALATLAHICTFAGRPKEAVRYFELAGDALPELTEQKDHRRAHKAASLQLPFVELAHVDAARRKQGILPDLLSAEAPMRLLPTPIWGNRMQGRLAAKGAGYYMNSGFSDRVLSDFEITVAIADTTGFGQTRWIDQATLNFLLPLGGHFGVGITIGGDLFVSLGGDLRSYDALRVPCPADVRPLDKGNMLRIVRHGYRVDVSVNDRRVATVLWSDAPVRYAFKVIGVDAGFPVFDVLVPTLGQDERPVREMRLPDLDDTPDYEEFF